MKKVYKSVMFDEQQLALLKQAARDKGLCCASYIRQAALEEAKREGGSS